MRAGAALLVAFEAIYFIVDSYAAAPLTPATITLNAGAMAITALVLAFTMTSWFERNWRLVCFANLLAIYSLTLALRLLTGDSEPLFITVLLTLIGAGALLRWSARWQAGLSAIALAMIVMPALMRASVGPETPYRWLGVLIAAALGHFILAMRERHRTELAGWMNGLRASHHELADALAQSATIMAERELAERRLREGEEMLRKIFDAAPDNITITRMSDGATLEVNREFLKTGYTREEILGVSSAKIGRWSRDQLRALVSLLRARGTVRNFEAELRNKDGRLVPSLIAATVVELDGEQCVISMSRDISELKRTEHELRAVRETALAASEAKSHFLSVMSHEIRTPMNAILGMADLLWETPLSAEQRRYLDIMRNNSASLLNLISGILDLSKVESGRLSLEHANFDLVELAEDVMETLSVRAHEKGLELALRIASTFPTALTGDPLRLRQILINLLSNAIKFTEQGEVTLTIDALGSAKDGESLGAQAKAEGTAASPNAGPSGKRQPLRFVVRDTGIGIPADRHEAIFSNFTQADSTISRKYGGSGLGLAIVKRLVELMDGKIAVESRPGEGSAFRVTIALELQPGAVAAGPTLAGRARLAGKRVLVVDDSQASRAILTELIELTGAELFVASDGAGALDELARARTAGRPYDAVVADNRMPPPDGSAIAQQIMEEPHTPREAIVLMLTANDLNAQLGRLRERGLEESPRCRYLRKPVRRADLWAILASVCSGTVDERASRNGMNAAAAAAHPARSDSFIQRGVSRTAVVLVNKPLRILLAEDSADNRLLIQAYLKNTPYRLDNAENGEVAVRKFATGHYDVILMDIEMPVMDGYEAIAEIRRLEQNDHRRTTPIIALTASAQDEAVRRSLQIGCDAHVIKPVKRSTLLETISDAVKAAPQAGDSGTDAGGASAERAAVTVPAQPIVVQIDQDLSDLVPGFLARKREDARAVLAAVEHGDSEAIARLGHKMKGEGGSYGLDAVTDLGRELEQAGKDRDFDAARRLGHDLMNFLERLEIVYRPMED
jgi:PAS domain S-box-containing protein